MPIYTGIAQQIPLITHRLSHWSALSVHRMLFASCSRASPWERHAGGWPNCFSRLRLQTYRTLPLTCKSRLVHTLKWILYFLMSFETHFSLQGLEIVFKVFKVLCSFSQIILAACFGMFCFHNIHIFWKSCWQWTSASMTVFLCLCVFGACRQACLGLCFLFGKCLWTFRDFETFN